MEDGGAGWSIMKKEFLVDAASAHANGTMSIRIPP
jgi:hypothetical protein